MATVNNDYSSHASMKEYWIGKVASNYWDLDDINLYNTGLFGYVNEVMGTVAEDSAYGSTVARREFYPTTAKFSESLHKMGALQQLDPPMSKPSSVRCILLLPEKDIISKASFSGGIYTYILDDCMNCNIGEKNYMLDFPITILAKQKGSGSAAYQYTTHYDISKDNSLNKNPNKYIKNKVLLYEGVNYLLLDVKLRQVTRNQKQEIITKNSALDITVLDIPFEGNIANFEVFYQDDSTSSEVQLSKYIQNSEIPQHPFCQYNMIDEHTLRIIFPYNTYFVPKFNSIVTIYIYTTEGADGDFKTYTGGVACSTNSEKYPYNATSTILGQVNGSSTGGSAAPTLEEYRLNVCDAYATNKVYVTDSDLQVYFNKTLREEKNRIVFSKKRDDILSRIYSAFMILKDDTDNIIPTNTLNMSIGTEVFDQFYESSKRYILKPGHLFQYGANPVGGINYQIEPKTGLSIIDDLSIYENPTNFLFTNPFLISVTTDPKVIGYYINSFDDVIPMEYKSVNDLSYIQWLTNSFTVKRNALYGENFYKMTLKISPSVSDSNLINALFSEMPDPSAEESKIKATGNGRIESLLYDDTKRRVVAKVRYDIVPPATDYTYQYIDVSSKVDFNTTTYEYTYLPGNTMQFNVGDTFLKGSVLAIKKPTDKGTLRMLMNIPEYFNERQLFIPFTLEDYDSDNMVFTMAAYFSTDDYISIQGNMNIKKGCWAGDSTNADDVVIPAQDFNFELAIFYKYDDTNYVHEYTSYAYFANHTLANKYAMGEDGQIRFIQNMKYIRSSVTFVPLDTPLPSGINYKFLLNEIPMVKANWLKTGDNQETLLDIVKKNYDFVNDVYTDIQNTFNIDLKFFNTYGKSRFYLAGSKDKLELLDRVNCSFMFGVKLDTLTSSEVFKANFIDYVKDYVESLNDITNEGKSIYIMNMIADIKANFDEILYLEYYGINVVDGDSLNYKIQKIQSMSQSEIIAAGLSNYTPEFINIYSQNESGVNVPQITIIFL